MVRFSGGGSSWFWICHGWSPSSIATHSLLLQWLAPVVSGSVELAGVSRGAYQCCFFSGSFWFFFLTKQQDLLASSARSLSLLLLCVSLLFWFFLTEAASFFSLSHSSWVSNFVAIMVFWQLAYLHCGRLNGAAISCQNWPR